MTAISKDFLQAAVNMVKMFRDKGNLARKASAQSYLPGTVKVMVEGLPEKHMFLSNRTFIAGSRISVNAI